MIVGRALISLAVAAAKTSGNVSEIRGGTIIFGTKRRNGTNTEITYTIIN